MLFLQTGTKSNLKSNCVIELRNEFNKVPGYKIEIQKLIVFVYNSNDWSENKIKKIISSKKNSK